MEATCLAGNVAVDDASLLSGGAWIDPCAVYRMPYTEPRSDFLQLLLELLRHSFVVVNARGLGALA